MAGLVLAIATSVGCYTGARGGAAHDEADDDGGESMGESGSGSSDSGGEPVDDDCDDPVAAQAVIRALNRREYANTVRDLFGLDESIVATAIASFPTDAIVRFDNHAESLVASDLLVEQQLYAAEALTQAADLATLLPCDPANGEDECAGALLDAFGKRAFRRPLTGDERDGLFAVYTNGRAAGRSFDAAVRIMLQSIVIAPQFLYRVETGVDADGGVADVDSFELATRLSYFLWASMPDDELLAAAESGALETVDEVEAQARRMLADPRSRATVAEFERQWLELYRLDTTQKDTTLVPDFDTVKPDLLAETMAFVDYVTWAEDGVADDLLVSDVVLVNDAVASYYGLGGAQGSEFVPVPATDERFGLLTQASLLSQFSNTNRTSPTRRGRFVRDRLLCQPPPPPPPNVPALPTNIDEDASVRERMAQHTSDPACSGCHTLIDPVGFGLEGYDLAGRYRTMENGAPVDVSGELTGVDVPETKFSGAKGLSDLLAQADEFEGCVASQAFEWAMGRSLAPEDDCTMTSLSAAMVASGGNIPDLLVTIATSQAFGRRAMEAAP